MPPKKFYAVAKGHKPGIYNNWPAAQAQVEGFHGAVYKGFPSMAEAEEWLKSPGFSKPLPASNKIKESSQGSILPESGEVTIYTDGGSSGNPGPGGFGIVQIYGNERKEISGGFRLTTNNRMELMGVIVALKNLEHKNLPIKICTDSSYVVNGITKGWAKSWRKNNWIKSDKTSAKNPDLWGELLDLIEPLKVTFIWVKGHAGNSLNERCDELAVSAAKGRNLPADEGYRG
ncbi:MAG TPA: ribonuclease HI [Spirochaetota bacterium]|nr:ribonuclease HI [Spirochaetota bacterium]HPS86934.1 ribonuclease HI [Spirochaetota bacterium]